MLVLKNKQVSTFLSENLISMKSRSREVFGKKCDLISLSSLTQIDLINTPTIKGMMFHHRPISVTKTPEEKKPFVEEHLKG